MNILIRTDSSYNLGAGHVMRDLVLAKRFSDAHIIFATQALPGNMDLKIKEEGFNVVKVESNTLDSLVSLIRKYAIEMIVIDHYGIDEVFEQQLKNRTEVKIFVVDDDYRRHCCDVLLNHNIFATAQRYNGLVPEKCELLCGEKYTLLREEFLREKKNRTKKKKNQVKNIFISMGGTDHTNLTKKVLETMLAFFEREKMEVKFHLLTTTSNKNFESLRKGILKYQNVTLHINSNEVAKLMACSDLAVVTPSVILNELFFMEIPFIAIKTAENQQEMCLFLKEKQYRVLDMFDKEFFNVLLNEWRKEDDVT